MSKVFLAGFKAGKGRYEQFVDTATGDSFIRAIDAETVIYRVNAGGWAYNQHGSIAGRFVRMDNGNYYYSTIDKDLRLNTKYSDLLEACRDVFSLLLSLGHKE